jgi:hypothetical protein
MVLALVLVLVPAIAIAAPAITQGVRGTVRDAITGSGIPFARMEVQIGSYPSTVFTADYDGTYSFSTIATDTVDVWAGAPFHSDDDSVVTVGNGAVTTVDFSLGRYSEYEQPVYRFFNMRGGVHFYTASDQEFMSVYKNLSGVFHYDGIAYYVPWGTSVVPAFTNPNTKPLYRFFNRKTGVHFYTMSEVEKNNVIATRGADYNSEGVAYYVSDDPSGLPIYRFYVPLRDAHFFTADSGEVFSSSQLSNYYHYEGIGFYIGDWVFNPKN